MKGDCATSQAVYGWKFGQYDLDSFAAAIVDAVHTHGTPKYEYYQSNIRALVEKDSWLLLQVSITTCTTKSGNWSVVPEPMRGANKLQTDDPYPQILDGITESIGSAGPIPMEAGEEE